MRRTDSAQAIPDPRSGMQEAWPSAMQDATQTPWRHTFTGLMRSLAAQRQPNGEHAMPPVGQAKRPQQERFKLGQQASLAFAPREIAQVELPGDQAHIRLMGLGMLGPNGPLPIHVTELARERSESRRDHTLRDFLDLFHHRYFTHMYRAWSQSQAAAGLDRAEEETFTDYVARLAGDEPSQVQSSALPAHARWASAAHRVRSARDPDGLVSTLQRFFGIPVRLLEYQLHWVPLANEDLCQLGRPLSSGMLGQGAMAGEKVPDRQTRFRLVMGPLDLKGYLRLTPQGHTSGQDLPALVEMVRSFIGFEYEWEVELLISAKAAPACQLGDSAQLGWSTWAGQLHSDSDHITGMVLEPERYVSSTAASSTSSRSCS